jgi:hypothetical protein
MLWVFTPKVLVRREDVFKPKIGNKSLHEISNDNGVRIVNLATSKILTAKIAMSTHHDTVKFIQKSPDGKTQIDCS